MNTTYHTLVIAVNPEAASVYPMLDITLPTKRGWLLSLQKIELIASNSALSASGTPLKKVNKIARTCLMLTNNI